jgi:hypothetical protein
MRGRRKTAPHNAEPDPTRVVPFGLRGVGLLTGHPIGLVIVFGVLLIGLIGIPEARFFCSIHGAGRRLWASPLAASSIEQ